MGTAKTVSEVKIMPLTKMEAENFTVFEKISIPFCRGLNVLVGENGVGKTHVMKIAYAACQASKHDVSFSQKSVMLFRPDQSSIGRLVNRRKNGNNTAKISVESDVAKIGMSFSIKTKKWDAEIKTEPNWEKQMSDLTSVFIPAKEILSNINPKYIPVLAELLIMLEREGVQIFVSTHDYFLSKYIEVKKKKDSEIQYISLYKDKTSIIKCEVEKEFELLEHKAIMDTFRQLYREEIGVVLQ